MADNAPSDEKPKQPVHQGDASQQEEQTIVLNHEEFRLK